jgi:hypothetical protein
VSLRRRVKPHTEITVAVDVFHLQKLVYRYIPVGTCYTNDAYRLAASMHVTKAIEIGAILKCKVYHREFLRRR